MKAFHTRQLILPQMCKFCESPLRPFITIPIHDLEPTIKDKSLSSIPTYVCTKCFLVQVENVAILPDQLRDYVSCFSTSWLHNMNQYIKEIFLRFEVTNQLVAELVSHRSKTRASGKANLLFGINGLNELIDMYGNADLLVCHDELAYVDDINNFVSAIKLFLKPTGIVTMEFLHLLPFMERHPYHLPEDAPFTYFSFTTIDTILKHHGLTVFDTQESIPKKSFRVFARHHDNLNLKISNNTQYLRGRERDMGMSSINYYTHFKEAFQSMAQR